MDGKLARESCEEFHIIGKGCYREWLGGPRVDEFAHHGAKSEALHRDGKDDHDISHDEKELPIVGVFGKTEGEGD